MNNTSSKCEDCDCENCLMVNETSKVYWPHRYFKSGPNMLMAVAIGVLIGVVFLKVAQLALAYQLIK